MAANSEQDPCSAVLLTIIAILKVQVHNIKYLLKKMNEGKQFISIEFDMKEQKINYNLKQ